MHEAVGSTASAGCTRTAGRPTRRVGKLSGGTAKRRNGDHKNGWGVEWFGWKLSDGTVRPPNREMRRVRLFFVGGSGGCAAPLRRATPLRQSYIGDMYRSGRGVERDDAEIVYWFRRAAEQGFAPGQTQLGDMYRAGQGVSQDDAEAVRWFRCAAEQGDPYGQTNLGLDVRERTWRAAGPCVEATRW